MEISKQLKDYVEANIMPQYNLLDAGHSPKHIHQVIQNSFEIARRYDVEADMVYVVAAYHDIGMLEGREHHETTSRKILQEDFFVRKFFSDDAIHIMGEAVEDHRASITHEPRSIYGKIVSEADRDIDFERILTRTIQFRLPKETPENAENEAKVLKDAYEHINEKYGPQSHLKFWLHYQKNIDKLQEIYYFLEHKNEFQEKFRLIYRQELAAFKAKILVK